MAKKPSRKPRKDRSGEEPEIILTPGGPHMERLLNDISRLLQEQHFETIEEANAYLEQLLASGEPLPAPQAKTPLDKAQAVMYDAWEAGSRRQRIRLARKALTISLDCADAYVLLAEESAETVEEAKEFYEAGVQAGERALGEEAFAHYEGKFWGVTETRPYMRAREGLAACLWTMEQRAEAISHYQEMLRLNPGDNQGIRYTLLLCLLEAGNVKEATRLLKAYRGEPTAIWLYSAALLSFTIGGPTRRANRQLREALRANPHVPDYLLGRRRVPRELPPYVGFGDETEAASYVVEAAHFWSRQEGAIDWLRQVESELG